MTNPVTSPAQAERIRRDILGRADHIPALPELVVRVLALLADRDTEPEDLANCLQYDPVLVGKMLALVNSPFYGVSREVSTIRDSIMVLGFRGLRSLILASSTAEYLERDYAVFGHEHKGLWKHSLAVASAARELAKVAELDSETREELFVSGLLHDIGKMLIGPLLNDTNFDPALHSDNLIEAEHKQLGIDHAEASALVAAKWNLSNVVQECLRHHHEPNEPEEMRTHLAIIRLADAFAHSMGIGYTSELSPEANFRAEDKMTIGQNDVQWQETRETIETVVANSVEQMAGLGS